MSNAIFARITITYGELNPTQLTPENSMLRRATCGWWPLNVHRCTGIKYIFGVYNHRVVSAYPVAEVGSRCWPTLHHARAVEGRGRYPRRFVPAEEAEPGLWKGAVGQQVIIDSQNPLRYGTANHENGSWILRVISKEENESD